MTYTIADITPGTSWACKFKVRTFLDTQGHPVNTSNIQLGETVPGEPGEYTSFGLITVRDVTRKLVEIQDQAIDRTWIVNWADCWDLDTVEWTESD